MKALKPPAIWHSRQHSPLDMLSAHMLPALARCLLLQGLCNSQKALRKLPSKQERKQRVCLTWLSSLEVDESADSFQMGPMLDERSLIMGPSFLTGTPTIMVSLSGALSFFGAASLPLVSSF